jgi:hypothetical protein
MAMSKVKDWTKMTTTLRNEIHMDLLLTSWNHVKARTTTSMGNVRINKGGKSMNGPFSLNGAHTPSVVMNIFRDVIYLNNEVL